MTSIGLLAGHIVIETAATTKAPKIGSNNIQVFQFSKNYYSLHKKTAHNAIQFTGPPLEIILHHTQILDAAGGTLDLYRIAWEVEESACQGCGKVFVDLPLLSILQSLGLPLPNLLRRFLFRQRCRHDRSTIETESNKKATCLDTQKRATGTQRNHNISEHRIIYFASITQKKLSICF